MAGDPDDSEIVIAPGGPRRADTVRHVPPGKAVRKLPDGSYEVVSETDEDGGDEGDDKRSET